MDYKVACPHCGEETLVEEPPSRREDVRTVEYQQDCLRCGEPVVAVFETVYELREVLAA
jgi:DNA-directed RNA polymerase subunit RPC12/RpoP